MGLPPVLGNRARDPPGCAGADHQASGQPIYSLYIKNIELNNLEKIVLLFSSTSSTSIRTALLLELNICVLSTALDKKTEFTSQDKFSELVGVPPEHPAFALMQSKKI